MNRRSVLSLIASLSIIGLFVRQGGCVTRHLHAKTSVVEAWPVSYCAADHKRWLPHFIGGRGWHSNEYTLWERVAGNGLNVRSTYFAHNGNQLIMWWKECEPRREMLVYFRPDGTQCEKAEYDVGYRIQCDTPLETQW